MAILHRHQEAVMRIPSLQSRHCWDFRGQGSLAVVLQIVVVPFILAHIHTCRDSQLFAEVLSEASRLQHLQGIVAGVQGSGVHVCLLRRLRLGDLILRPVIWGSE